MYKTIFQSWSIKIITLLITSIISITAINIASSNQAKAQTLPSTQLSSSELISLSLPKIPKVNIPTIPGINNVDPRVHEILIETNKLRAKHGLAPVKADGNLDKVAQNWAWHLAKTDTLNHHPRFWESYPSYNTRGGSENILQAWNSYSAYRLTQLWYNSPGHRKNMLDPDAKTLGVGIAVRLDGKLYAVQNFAY